MSQFTGMEALKKISESGVYEDYTTRTMFHREKKYKYDPYRIFLGWDTKGRPVHLPVRTSKIILIAGKRGAGKTFLLRALMNRLYLSGHIPIILTDIKGEYKSSKKPVQKKFAHLLYEGEEPTAFPIRSYHPAFLEKYSPEPGDIPCQLSLDKITRKDMETILGYDIRGISPKKKELLMRVFEKVEGGDIFTFKEFIRSIWIDEDAGDKTKESVINSVRTAIKQGILGDEYSDFDWTDDVVEEYIPVLNLKGFKEHYGYTSAFISVVAKQVIESKKRGLIERGKKIFYFIDEAHRWLGALNESSAKKTLINIMREARSAGVSLVCATQTLNGLDEAVRKQTSFILFPSRTDAPTVMGIMKEAGLYERYGKFADDLNKNLQMISKMGGHVWVLVDMDKRDIRVIKKLGGPLSFHQEEI